MEASHVKLEGLITALVTPFKEGRVDFSALAEHISFQIEAGVDGILALGSTGEAATLTLQEQEKIVRLCVEMGKGKTLILCGTGTNCTESTIEKTSWAQSLGVDVALVVVPYYNRPMQHGLYAHFSQVAAKVDIPICVYNVPKRTGCNMTAKTLEMLSHVEGIVGVKESAKDFTQVQEILTNIAQKNTSFSLLSGDDEWALPILSLGGHGVISVASNLIPRELKEFVNTIREGELERSCHLQAKFSPLFNALGLESNPIPIKAMLALHGRMTPECRLPLTALQEENYPHLAEVLQTQVTTHSSFS